MNDTGGDGRPASAIVLAGGVGSRYSNSAPKQLARLAGRPVIEHVLQRFDDWSLFKSMAIVCHQDAMESIQALAKRALYQTPFRLISGGDTRNESILRGLDALSVQHGKVVVHDGVRPLATRRLTARVIDALDAARAVLPVIPSADLIATVVEGEVLSYHPRDQVLLGQSPQGFYVEDLAMIRGQASIAPELTEYRTMFEAWAKVFPGRRVCAVEGDPRNLKLTLPTDRLLIGQLLLEDLIDD